MERQLEQWNDRFSLESLLPPTSSTTSPKPAQSQPIQKEDAICRLPSEDMHMFGKSPLAENLLLVQCTQCLKTLLASSFQDHLKHYCHARHSSPMKHSPNRTPSRHSNPLASQLLAEEEPVCLEEEPGVAEGCKRFQPAMIDFDRQCGVTTLTGTPCTRPITCRLHSTYAKSTVHGRLLNFFELLSQHYARIEHQLQPQSSPKSPLAAAAMPPKKLHVEEMAVVEMDQDIKALLAVIQQKRPLPLAHRMHISMKKRTSALRLRHVLFPLFMQVQSPSFKGTVVTETVTEDTTQGEALSLASTSTPVDGAVGLSPSKGADKTVARKKPASSGGVAKKKRESDVGIKQRSAKKPATQQPS